VKVCFVSLHAYPLFRPASRGIFGGSELRAWTFARELARLGHHDLSFIVLDHGQPRCEQIGGITVIAHDAYPAEPARMSRAEQELRRLAERLDWRRRWSIEGIRIPDERLLPYRRAGADVYVAFGVSNIAAELALHCNQSGARLAVFAGSDLDFSETYRAGSDKLNVYGATGRLCRFAIMSAHTVITQTDTQRRLALERFGVNAFTLRNPIALGERTEQGGERRFALWVGKSDAIKQPEVFCRVARAVPALQFVMLMNRSDDGIFRRIQSALPGNVRLIEQLPPSEAEHLFEHALVLVNTSRFEGFPNAFLQAGKHRVPVLSLLVNPDAYLAQHGCGVAADGSEERLTHELLRLMRDTKRVEMLGAAHRRYVEKYHRLEDRVAELDKILMGMRSHG